MKGDTFMRRIFGITLAVTVVFAMTISSATNVYAQAQTPTLQTKCDDGLASHGPISVFGFPDYYETQDGVLLDHCDQTTDVDAICGNPPFDGDPAGEGLPVDLPPDVAIGNFWGESFYFLGIANTPSCLLFLAIEAVWDNADEAIIDGDQLVFARIRIRCDLTDPGTYLVTHPFGTDMFDVTAADIAATAGRRAINATDDCLHVVVDGVITPT